MSPSTHPLRRSTEGRRNPRAGGPPTDIRGETRAPPADARKAKRSAPKGRFRLPSAAVAGRDGAVLAGADPGLKRSRPRKLRRLAPSRQPPALPGEDDLARPARLGQQPACPPSTPCRLHHRQHPCPDRLGQPGPGIDDESEVGGKCAGFCAARRSDPRFSRGKTRLFESCPRH